MKRKIFIVISLLIIIFLLVKSYTKVNFQSNISHGDVIDKIKGDVNDDGKVNSLDYIIIRKHIMGLSKLDSNKLAYADINNDNKVNSLDYVIIRKIILKQTDVPSTNGKTYKASFIIQDEKGLTSSASSLECYTSNSNTCEITAPILIAKGKTEALGWSKVKTSTTEEVKGGGKIVLNKDVTYYSVSKTLISITYHVGEDIPGVNTKAQKLSFYNNSHTQCYSYNGNGCSIKWIPAIYSPGHVVHGFSETPSGNTINVAKTKFTEDTILYARIYDCETGGCRPKSFQAATSELIGNVWVDVAVGVNDGGEFIKFLKKLYSDFPNMFMWNGKISLHTQEEYKRTFGEGIGGLTSHGGKFSSDFSSVDFYYRKSTSKIDNYFLAVSVHEIGHAYNRALYYNGGMSGFISDTSDIKNLYNKYINTADRPLGNGSYSSTNEFFSDLMEEYYRYYSSLKNYTPYTSAFNPLNQEFIAVAEKYHKIGKDYYKSIGRL